MFVCHAGADVSNWVLMLHVCRYQTWEKPLHSVATYMRILVEVLPLKFPFYIFSLSSLVFLEVWIRTTVICLLASFNETLVFWQSSQSEYIRLKFPLYWNPFFLEWFPYTPWMWVGMGSLIFLPVSVTSACPRDYLHRQGQLLWLAVCMCFFTLRFSIPTEKFK